jgi:carbohydrate kinase (thermoresistant glucokinase family)
MPRQARNPRTPWATVRPPVQIIVLMGVSGAGKTTTGKRLAATLGWPYRDADEFHPAANIAKMASGQPLDDADRAPWLAAIADWIDCQRTSSATGIVSCSALRRAYREVLVGGRPDVALVYLKGSKSLIADRLSRRRGHFMPTALLASQFAALEEPVAEEAALYVSMRLPPKRVVERIVDGLALSPARRVGPAVPD